jgi:hypothetical protein
MINRAAALKLTIEGLRGNQITLGLPRSSMLENMEGTSLINEYNMMKHNPEIRQARKKPDITLKTFFLNKYNASSGEYLDGLVLIFLNHLPQ